LHLRQDLARNRLIWPAAALASGWRHALRLVEWANKTPYLWALPAADVPLLH
jgi:hypothetical protein